MVRKEQGNGGADFDDANQAEWLQLNRLYAALGERDVLMGISARAARKADTKLAGTSWMEVTPRPLSATIVLLKIIHSLRR